jgi:osmotically-inducible protein OsmY
LWGASEVEISDRDWTLAGIEIAPLSRSLLATASRDLYEGFAMSALSVPQSSLPAADERLAQMVSLAIHQRAVRVPAEFRVLAQQSTVTLRGRTRTFYEKQLLLHAVQRVPGVRQIVDEIEVLPSNAGR